MTPQIAVGNHRGNAQLRVADLPALEEAGRVMLYRNPLVDALDFPALTTLRHATIGYSPLLTDAVIEAFLARFPLLESSQVFCNSNSNSDGC